MCVYNNVWQFIPMYCDSVRKEDMSHSYEVTIIILNNAHSSYEYFLKEYYKTCESYVPLRKLRKSNNPF